MTDAIRYLETIGASPALANEPDAVAAAVAALGIDERQKRALLGNDAGALGKALGGRELMRCLILTPDE